MVICDIVVFINSQLICPKPPSPDIVDARFIEGRFVHNRIRRIHGGFSFVPHRFLSQGFLSSLQQKEILLYLFLVLASDRHGLSFYSYDKICTLLQMDLDQYISARNGLIDKDLIAFDGTVFQVLELPATSVSVSKPREQKRSRNQATIAQLADQSLKQMER